MNLALDLQVAAGADRTRRRAPFADAVHRQHRRIGKWRGEERACGVAEMMLGEQQLVLPVEVRREFLQLAPQQILLKQLLANPDRDRRRERAEAARREGDVGFEQPLELQERLFVEDDIVDVGERDLASARQ